MVKLRERLRATYYDYFKPILMNKKAFLGFILLACFGLMATIGPIVVPLDLTTKWAERLEPPSLEHPLGTDYYGCDIFQQIVHGSRDVLLIGSLAALYGTLIAIAMGIASGYLGGKVDATLMGVTDIFLTIPSLPVMMIMAACFRVTDPFSFSAIIALWMWAGLARSVRAQVRSVRSRDFIEAAKVLNLGTPHIIFKEILPNVLPYIAINFVRMMKDAITASVGVMFLGLAPFSKVHWGIMLQMAMSMTGVAYTPWGLHYVMAPLLSIMLLEFGAVLFANGVEEIVNPRLKGYE